MTSPRAPQDSGLIDLIAIDREARERAAVREAEEVRARSEVPPVMHDLSGAADDVDEFARSMASPWSRLAKADRRSKIAAACGGALLMLGIVIFSVSGSSDAAKSAAVAAPPSPPSTALPANIPPPPPVPVAAPSEPAAKPAPVGAAARPTTEERAPSKAKKPAAAAPRKGGGKGHGPKLMKVQSSGV